MVGSEQPPQCTPSCPVINGADVAGYPIAFTKNCNGPVLRTDEISSHVRIHNDGTTEEIGACLIEVTRDTPDLIAVRRSHGRANGELVCRNAGVVASINNLMATSTEQ